MNLVVTSVFSLGFGSATGLCYFAGDGPRRKADTIWTSVFILMLSVLVMSASAYIFPRQISEILFHTPDHNRLVTLSMLSAGTIILNAQFMLYLMFEKRAVLYVVITTTVTLLSLALSVLTVVFLGRGVAGVIESLLISHVAGLIMLIIPTIRGLPIRLNGDIALELLRFGIPLIPSALFLFILQPANQYILERFRGLDEVGVYVIGFSFGAVMNFLVSAFSSAWYPHFMAFMNHPEEARYTFGRVITGYILGFGVTSLLFYALAKPVVLIMTQLPFHDAYKVVGMTSTAYFLSGLFMLLLPAVYFAKEVKYISVIQGVSALVAVLLNLALIPWLGLIGAALALVLGHVALVVFQYAWNRYRQGVYLQIYYDWKRIARFGTFYVLIAALTLWPRHCNILYEIMLSVCMSAMLIFVLYILLTEDEKRFLTSIITQMKP
jgi:O-antigen/teichoic acid export membrane protein